MLSPKAYVAGTVLRWQRRTPQIARPKADRSTPARFILSKICCPTTPGPPALHVVILDTDTNTFTAFLSLQLTSHRALLSSYLCMRVVSSGNNQYSHCANQFICVCIAQQYACARLQWTMR